MQKNSDKLYEQAQSLIDARQFSSIEWQLAQHGNVLSSGRVSTPEADASIASPIYRIYSMTKPIVSLVAVQLIAEQKLKLSDNVKQFIPAMGSLHIADGNGKQTPLAVPISIEHLLTHTAGFSYDFLPDCAVAERYREAGISGQADRSLAEVIGLLTTMPLVSQPGAQWRYSVATDVLAHVLENVTDMALPELLSERVFKPLGMIDTAFHVPENKVDRLMPMFGARELGQVMVESDEPNTLTAMDVELAYPHKQDSGFYRGGHGLFSTMEDYLKFIHVLKTGASIDGQTMVDSKNFENMWQNKLTESLLPMVLGFNVLGGYGWNLFGRVMQNPAQCEFKSSVGEGGWAGAASTYFWVDRANDLSGIAMSQYLGSTPHLGALMQHAAYGMLTDVS